MAIISIMDCARNKATRRSKQRITQGLLVSRSRKRPRVPLHSMRPAKNNYAVIQDETSNHLDGIAPAYSEHAADAQVTHFGATGKGCFVNLLGARKFYNE